jgi:hypothetical protein
MCNQQLRVLREQQTSSISRVVVLQEGYIFDAANYTLEHNASGAQHTAAYGSIRQHTQITRLSTMHQVRRVRFCFLAYADVC